MIEQLQNCPFCGSTEVYPANLPANPDIWCHRCQFAAPKSLWQQPRLPDVRDAVISRLRGVIRRGYLEGHRDAINALMCQAEKIEPTRDWLESLTYQDTPASVVPAEEKPHD